MKHRFTKEQMSRGGSNRVASQSPEVRSYLARKAVEVRWKRFKARQKQLQQRASE